ncbi:PilW family protein [Pseudomonas lopnurensis]|uniref:PilW family protein n=1 Tax=Pseudomonas lopnurensis TaxID=1477517 RepID=UPI001879E912|nr:type II secretion system protein [Pseudomonas lopnurensis]MBE7374788.1 type II secretion system protein [Pseudomonas lopnurensis]
MARISLYPRPTFVGFMAQRAMHAFHGSPTVTMLERNRQGGFTLVELIMVIALAGIVVVLVGTALNRPMKAFMDQRSRAELTDQAAIVLDRITRDIRLAVPNSVRVPDSRTLDLIPIVAAGRYRANVTDAGTTGRYDPPYCEAGEICRIPMLGPVDTEGNDTPHYLIIYNTGSAGNDAWQANTAPVRASISPKVFTWQVGGWSENGTLVGNGVLTGDFSEEAAFRFASASPQHRFYLASEAVRYTCSGTDNSVGQLVRRSYPRIRSNLSENIDDFTQGQLTPHVMTQCSFTYDPGTLTRNGLVSISLQLTQNDESVTLYRQVQVSNAP